MTSPAIKGFTYFVMAGVGLFGVALMSVSSAHAQVSISNDGVTYPDDTEQTSAVIVPMNCPHGDSIVWDSNAVSWVCETDLSGLIFAIGDTGPAGGIVFYVAGGGLHGLEAPLADQGIDVQWGCSATSITGADGLLIGTGAQNTADIIAGCATAGIAARVAELYVLNDSTDWFLPSKDELNQLYLQRAKVGGFAESGYLSSSEFNDFDAWFQGFASGAQGNLSKEHALRVRAVRAF